MVYVLTGMLMDLKVWFGYKIKKQDVTEKKRDQYEKTCYRG